MDPSASSRDSAWGFWRVGIEWDVMKVLSTKRDEVLESNMAEVSILLLTTNLRIRSGRFPRSIARGCRVRGFKGKNESVLRFEDAREVRIEN